MDSRLLSELKQSFSGDVMTDPQTLSEFSHDTSLFEVMPQLVVCPKTEKDVVELIKFVSTNKKEYPDLSLTGRSAGTDMAGGSINDSIIVNFLKYFNNTPVVHVNYATTQPGVFYRDFEKETLKHNLIFPSYPASREICAMGGIVNNNSGGEKSLKYGKTEKYVKRVKVVLSDGSIAEFKPLDERQLKEKMKLKNFEGKIYREMFSLISKNYDEIEKNKPKVSKNSAGYDLWNVWDKEKKIFDLTKLWVGAQGTLGLLLEADINLIPVKKYHHAMLVIYLQSFKDLGKIIDAVMPLDPESFDSYDNNTLILALKYFPEFTKQLGIFGLIQAGLAFLPAFLNMLIGKMPILILQPDFVSEDLQELKQKITKLKQELKSLHLQTTVAIDDQEKKYWLVRRESFNLLRKKVRNKHTAPFIDDIVIDPYLMGEIMPQITNLLKKHPEFIFAGQGHIGDGNFHIIPLVDIKNPNVRKAIPEISDAVYKIIGKYHGSITGEHNDGLIRTPYLREMFSVKMLKLFEKTKEIFDPQNIFNPRKKVNGSLHYAMEHIRTNW